MIGTFRTSRPRETGNARCQALCATFHSTQTARHEATDRADIRELKSRLKALRHEMRALRCACPPR
jgi:hypothetical protein